MTSNATAVAAVACTRTSLCMHLNVWNEAKMNAMDLLYLIPETKQPVKPATNNIIWETK